MGIIKSINDWEVEVGENIGGYIPDILKDSAGFLCDIRAKYPNSFFDRSFGRGLANSICRTVDKENPEVEPPPFSGGQCEGVLYIVTVTVDRYVNGDHRQTLDYTFNGVPGAIVGVTEGQDPVDPRLVYLYIETTNPPDNVAVTSRLVGGAGISVVITNVTVEPRNPGEDVCGDASPSYPPDAPRDSSDFSTTFTACDRDENGNNINCEELPVDLPEKENYDFPVCLNVDGKQICLDADGWSIEDAPTPEEEEEEEAEETEEEFEEKEILTWVLISINEILEKTPTIVRPDDKDTVVFAGYISFAYTYEGGTFWLPAQEIRKQKNAFKVAEDTQEYSVYTNFGIEVEVTEVKETIKVPIPSEDEDGGDTIETET